MHQPLFESPLTDWHDDRAEFINWCGFYYHTYISCLDEDRPPEDMMDKDALLDFWLEEHRHRKKNASKSNIKSAVDQGEVFEAY